MQSPSPKPFWLERASSRTKDRKPVAGSPLALRWILMRSSRARRFARRCLDAELKQHDCKTCLPTGATMQKHTICRARAMLLFQRGLLHNLRLGIAQLNPESMLRLSRMLHIAWTLLRRMFFGSESQIRTGDQRIMIPLL